jgi:hypothetical protein
MQISEARSGLLLRDALVVAGALTLALTSGAHAATVAYWRFDGDGKTAGQTAGTVLSSVGGHHGEGVASPIYSSDSAVDPVPRTLAPNSLSLDFERDSVQAIEVAHSAALSLGASPFTIEAWVRLETLADGTNATRTYLLQKKGDAGVDVVGEYGFMVQASNRTSQATPGVGKQSGFTGRELAYTWGDGTSQFFVISNLEIADTAWHFASLAFDGGDEVRFGVDGVFETVSGLAAFGHTTNAGQLVIGARTTGGGALIEPFDGRIDELRISDAALSPGELLDAAPSAVPSLSAGGVAFLGFVLAATPLWVTRRRAKAGAIPHRNA